MQYRSVVMKDEVFGEAFEPDGLPGRVAELKSILSWLGDSGPGSLPRHVWMSGPSGTGKTCVARHVMRQWARGHVAETAYVNCWRCNTVYKVAEHLVDRLSILLAEKQQTEFKLERVRRRLAGRPFLIVLDELEQALPMDRSEIVRGLLDLGETSLLCISRSVESFYRMDEGTRARLSPRTVAFAPYPSESIVEMLRSRAEVGLAQGAWSDSVLQHIASLARGNARAATRTLGVAAGRAEQEHSPVIRECHVDYAWQDVKDTPKDCVLSALTPDHRMLYELVRRQGSLTSGELYARYRRECEKTSRSPIAARTFSNYVNRLADAHLITAERARLRGRTKLFRILGNEWALCFG